MKVNLEKMQYVLFLLYLIAISAHQLTTGIDPLIVRVTFFGFIIISLLVNRRVAFNSQVKWILCFWGYYFLSLVWAKNIDDTLLCVNSSLQVVAISFCLPLIINGKNDVQRMLKFFIFSLLYTSILLFIKTPLEHWGVTRVGHATGLHQNTAGMRMAIGSIICLYCFHTEKLNKNKLFYLVAMIIFVAIAIFTGSKKAILIIVIGAFLYELLNSKGAEVVGKVVIMSLLFVILGYLMLNNEAIYNVLGDRIESTINTLIGNEVTDESLLERNYYIEEAMNLFFRYPLLGYGGNNFMSYMREIGYKHVAYSHNNYTELLSTLGIIGFVIYYYMWVKVLVELFDVYLKKSSKCTLLFFIIFAIILVMDYANVSYYSDFNMILLIIANMLLKFEREEKTSSVE